MTCTLGDGYGMKEECPVGKCACRSMCDRDAHQFGLLLSRQSAWVGVHYSSHNRRLCVNLLPFVTLWWTQPGGVRP